MNHLHEISNLLTCFPLVVLDFQKTGGAAEKVKEKVEQRRKSIVSKFSLGHFSILSFVSPPPLVILPDSKSAKVNSIIEF